MTRKMFAFALLLFCCLLRPGLGQNSDITGKFSVSESWTITLTFGTGAGTATHTYTGTEKGTLSINNGSYNLINALGIPVTGLKTARNILADIYGDGYDIYGKTIGVGGYQGEFYVIVPLTFFVVKVPVGPEAGFSGGDPSGTVAFFTAGFSLDDLTGSGSYLDVNAAIQPDTEKGYVNEVDYSSTASLGKETGPACKPPTFSPKPGTYAGSVSVTLNCATAKASIFYTTDGSAPDAYSTLYVKGNPIRLTTTTTINAIATSSGLGDSAVTSAAYVVNPTIVLLLPGLNSGPSIWAPLLANAGATAPIFSDGQLKGADNPTPDAKNVTYYCVEFGAFDQSLGEVGLGGLKASGPQNGDFTPIFDLAGEVNAAVLRLLTLHQNAEILLVGHSRGGLAGRAFMETTGYKNASAAVVGLLTIGSPHQGTPFGRLWNYLETNLNSPDWNIVSDLNLAGLFTSSIDFRVFSISDMGIGSSSISMLNSKSAYLPATAKYGTLVFGAVSLGQLDSAYNVFKGASYMRLSIPPLSAAGSKAVTLSRPVSEYAGDGVSALSAQTFVAADRTILRYNGKSGTLHMNEPSDVADIEKAMRGLVNWWNQK